MLEKWPESLGHALQGRRSGMENIVFRQLLLHREVPHIDVRSSAFDQMAAIPVQFTADGAGTSPPLEWHGVPSEAQCVVLIVEDADSPTPHPLVHAILVADGSGDSFLPWGALSDEGRTESGEPGLNSYLQKGWLPPDPPPGHGMHRYAFQVFALVGGKVFSRPLGRQELLAAVRERAIAAGCLVGTYERLRRQQIDETGEAKEVAAADSVTAAV
jgi:phosphatidylethanolamine-binding protein (PEBP) family uncharacterized protein